jgi:predicted CopG family antitoxin
MKRRTISVRGTTYEQLVVWARDHNRSLSDIIEEQLARLLGTAVPRPAAQVRKMARERAELAPKVARAPRQRVDPPPKPSPTMVPPRPPPRPARLTARPNSVLW